MTPAWIRPRDVAITRRNPKGRTYQVLYRRGGRGWPIESAGTFKLERDARSRRDLVAGWLASGLDPKAELAALRNPPPPPASLEERAEQWLRGRLDLDEKSVNAYRTHLRLWLAALGGRDPASILWEEVQDVVTDLSGQLKAQTVQTYHGTFAALLDDLDVKPNPAHDKRVKLPPVEREEHMPPDVDHYLAILANVTPRWRLLFVTIEQCATRISETLAWEWGDADVPGCRILSRKTAVKGRRGRRKSRWVQVPEWLMAILAETCPPEDRLPERRIFFGTDEGARSAMRRACKTAQIPHYHPHDLRHRRTSLWHGQGVPAKELAERVGHTDAWLTLNVYSHVMPLAEAPVERLQELCHVMTR